MPEISGRLERSTLNTPSKHDDDESYKFRELTTKSKDVIVFREALESGAALLVLDCANGQVIG